MPADCVFCKIISREFDTELVYEDEAAVAFKDINPIAPVHLLVVPRKHIPTLLDLDRDDEALIGHLHAVINELARAYELDKTGYRVITNCGRDAGQAVFHLHLHLIGGKPLK
ncbi:MAG TPA: histidine triad nucleotide-binding protein [Candidatus Limnocylindrales bacterium]|nr:histidine triad nucleotide-binding protein [Candidatus Limnocylindrales bacterium]